jgi:hypothetical protein
MGIITRPSDISKEWRTRNAYFRTNVHSAFDFCRDCPRQAIKRCRSGVERVPRLLMVSEARRTARGDEQHDERKPADGGHCDNDHGCLSARASASMRGLFVHAWGGGRSLANQGVTSPKRSPPRSRRLRVLCPQLHGEVDIGAQTIGALCDRPEQNRRWRRVIRTWSSRSQVVVLGGGWLPRA